MSLTGMLSVNGFAGESNVVCVCFIDLFFVNSERKLSDFCGCQYLDAFGASS